MVKIKNNKSLNFFKFFKKIMHIFFFYYIVTELANKVPTLPRIREVTLVTLDLTWTKPPTKSNQEGAPHPL